MPLAITPGEPAGIGPDLCVQLAKTIEHARPVFFADENLLRQRAEQLDIVIQVNRLEIASVADQWQRGFINIVHIPLAETATCGQLNAANSAYILETLRQAVDACQQGYCDAIVTAPVHKGIINDGGFPFSGHTEFIAERVQANPVMMLACPGLRVALATTHLLLSEVSRAINQAGLKELIRAIHHDLQTRFAIAAPVIYVCGLNPHAGEGGHLGREEIEVISPALEALRQSDNINIIGPLSADTLFTPKYLQHADVVVAMFHDQGLPVLKHMGFGQAVNITLGLPIIRTSVDHGTALELAGTGKADTGSLLLAVETALEMVKNSRS